MLPSWDFYYEIQMQFEKYRGEPASVEEVLKDPSKYTFAVYGIAYSMSGQPTSTTDLLRVKDLTSEEHLIRNREDFLTHTEPNFDKERVPGTDHYIPVNTNLRNGDRITKSYIERSIDELNRPTLSIGSLDIIYGTIKKRLFGPEVYQRSVLEISKNNDGRQSISWSFIDRDVSANWYGAISSNEIRNDQQTFSTLKYSTDLTTPDTLSVMMGEGDHPLADLQREQRAARQAAIDATSGPGANVVLFPNNMTCFSILR